MSHYDLVRKRLNRLDFIDKAVTFVPTVILLALGIAISWNRLSVWPIFGFCWLGMFLLPKLFRAIFEMLIPPYRRLLVELKKTKAEVNELRSRVEAIYSKYRQRNKGEQFKRTYELVGKRIDECEERLAVGMRREQKEIFVTCFIRANEVVRVTAAIGSPSRCAPKDNLLRWQEHIQRLGCTEIRQYHNHPIYNNRASPSAVDHITTVRLKEILAKHGDKLRSYLIYWNQIGEWRIVEYDGLGKHWMTSELDITASLQATAFTKLI